MSPGSGATCCSTRSHPNEMGVAEVEACLTHLAVEDQVAASTQNQVLSVLPFLYAEGPCQPLEDVLELDESGLQKAVRRTAQ